MSLIFSVAVTTFNCRKTATRGYRSMHPASMPGKIMMTVMRTGRRHGRAAGQTRPKEAALAATRCLNPHPEQVTDPAFLASEFFDARDAVQVKYEMVRKVKADGVRSPRRPRRSGTPGPPTTRQPPPWTAPGWKAWSRPGPDRAGRTSSPARSSPTGPSSSWPPAPACARRSWCP